MLRGAYVRIRQTIRTVSSNMTPTITSSQSGRRRASGQAFVGVARDDVVQRLFEVLHRPERVVGHINLKLILFQPC